MQEGMEVDREVMAVKKRMGNWQAVTGSMSTKHGIGSEASLELKGVDTSCLRLRNMHGVMSGSHNAADMHFICAGCK
jgi:hypothetical protein